MSDSTMKNAAAAQPVDQPDASWRGLYLAGGIAALLYVILAIVVPALMVLIPQYDFKMEGAALLEFISSNRTWWVVLQSLVLETGILLMVTFAALFAALKRVNKSFAAVGALIAVVCQVLFMAYYPVLLGLVYLSDQYAGAAAARQGELAVAAEALIAQNNAFNPVYESLFAAGVLVISLVMLKGVFRKWIAWLGVATFAAAVTALVLYPVVGLAYFWWWLVFTVWIVAVGVRLIRLGRS
jgi:hypothetical protein